MSNINIRDRLAKHGVSTFHNSSASLPENSAFEPPCSMKWMSAHYRLRLSAFSYAVSGYYFDVCIGRYTSIGEAVQVGRGSHPVDWISTSPVFYANYRDVTDVYFEQAEGIRFDTPAIHAKQTIIGNDVYIGHGAFIMQGVTIGDGAIVGACSVVTKDVPPFAVVAGSPARVRRMRFPEKTIERLCDLQWWRFPIWDLEGANPAKVDAFIDHVYKKIDSGMKPYRPDMVILKDVLRESE